MDTLVLVIRSFYAAVPAAIVALHYNVLGLSQLKSYGKVLAGSAPTSSHVQTWLDHVVGLTIPKSYFTHFYILGSLWCLVLYSGLVFQWADMVSLTASPETFLAMSFMIVQVFRRLFECLFVHQPSSGARIHVFHYVNGMLFYSLTPVAVVIEHVEYDKPFESLSAMEFLEWRHILACGLFGFASLQQTVAHLQLASLRSNDSRPNTENKRTDLRAYKLPTQGYFALVAAPHYFFEVCIYTSFVVLYGFRDLTTILILVCVTVELGISAHDNREWYRTAFGCDKLPKNWKRMIPYLY
ncbi:3-oxo-5-alpha-steroid 4-dehydrogenase-domain-containing protein [Obelidium mucronatum]|nr:3-oxo-5-alpha-steroid 4-dehydrogenase-domain-containing protein [Obelidium mucronatum]